MSDFLKLSKQLKLRLGISFFGTTIGSAIWPFMTMYYMGFYGPITTGAIIIANQIINVFVNLYAGHLSDRYGRRTMLLIGIGISVVGYFMVVFSNIPGHVLPIVALVGFVIAGIGQSINGPVLEAMIIELTTPSDRQFVFGLNYWILNISVMIGAGLAGLFYDNYLFELFIVLATMEAIIFTVVYFNFAETLRDDMRAKHGASVVATLKNYGNILQDTRYTLYAIGGIGFSMLFGQPDFYMSVNLRENFVHTNLFGFEITGAKMLSLVLFINTVLIIIFMSTVTRLIKNVELVKQFVIGASIFAVGMISAFTFNIIWAIIIATIVFTIGEMIEVSAGQTIRADLMNPKKIGSYSGLWAMTRPLGNIISGLLVSMSHFTGTIGVTILVSIISVFSIWLSAKAARMQPTFKN